MTVYNPVTSEPHWAHCSLSLCQQQSVGQSQRYHHTETQAGPENTHLEKGPSVVFPCSLVHQPDPCIKSVLSLNTVTQARAQWPMGDPYIPCARHWNTIVDKTEKLSPCQRDVVKCHHVLFMHSHHKFKVGQILFEFREIK